MREVVDMKEKDGEVRMIPFHPDPDPCVAFGCAMRTESVETCRQHRCPHRWTREAAEDRQRREERDAKEKENV